MMLGLGMGEMVVIGAILIGLFLVPKQLPKWAKSIGETVREGKKIGKELRGAADEVKSDVHQIKRDLDV